MAVFVSIEDTPTSDDRLVLVYKGLDEEQVEILVPWLLEQREDAIVLSNDDQDGPLRVSFKESDRDKLLWFGHYALSLPATGIFGRTKEYWEWD